MVNPPTQMNENATFRLFEPFYTLWLKFVETVPRVLGAILILLLGWVVAVAVANIVRRILVFSHIDTAIRRTGLSGQLEKVGVRVSFANLLSWFTKWFILLFVFIAASDVLHWTQVSSFLNQVILFIPRIVVAALIVFGAMFISQYVYDLLQRMGTGGSMISGRILAQVARSSILVIAVMMALIELGIAATLIHIAFAGLIVMVAVAGGIAFGVGGIDKARELINQIKSPQSAQGTQNQSDTPPTGSTS